MCFGGSSSSPPPVDQSFTVNPVPPNVIDPEDAYNFPNAETQSPEVKAPTTTRTSASTGLQIPLTGGK